MNGDQARRDSAAEVTGTIYLSTRWPRRPNRRQTKRLARSSQNDPHRLEVTAGVDKSLVAVRRSRRPRLVHHEAFATATDEAEHVAVDVVARLEAGTRPGAIAILVRTNADAAPVLESLQVRGVPVRASGSSGLFGHREVRDLLSLVRTIDAPGRSEDSTRSWPLASTASRART